jgi:TetR/AcrR family transcriptional regulator
MEDGVAEPHKSRIRRENLKRILKAAEQVFADRGYAGATMAEMAQRAKLPKANLHYYFGTKEELYRAVLDAILAEWIDTMAGFVPEADPKTAVSAYIRAKMEFSRVRPHASRVFANEIIHGAPILAEFLGDTVRRGVEEKSAVIQGWADSGKVAPLDGRHLFFMIWSLTQHYADFEVQVRAVLGKHKLSRDDWDHATQQVETVVLRALGLAEGR